MTAPDTGYAVIGDVFHKTEMDAVLKRLFVETLPRTKAGASPSTRCWPGCPPGSR